MALILSEALGGWLKRTDGYTHREASIHEMYYSFGELHASFVRAGFSPRYLFSAYYDQLLLDCKINPSRRFARFGELVARFWKFPGFRSVAHTRDCRNARLRMSRLLKK